MATPCIGACKNDGGICHGCKRTMNEVAIWSQISDNERQQTMAELSGQLSTHLCQQCGEPAYCDISAGKDTCWCFDIEKRDTSELKTSNLCLCRRCLSKLPLK
ncbi:DUF1289 domain-containing protein [Vibrio hippocampi]|uniref:DUF1289 domain-containing protein n=1 Tax=Vibrio hippocampi TaxID=654686 RepID=UPI001F2905ED|nr:DUF1289 domain-containing protein [Vibrio hippocampi]